MTFKVNDDVWVYRSPCEPWEGVITEVLSWGIRVNLPERKMAPNEVHAKSCVFCRPQEAEKLIHQMLDDASFIEKCARDLAGKQRKKDAN